jgi:hypothetical protein
LQTFKKEKLMLKTYILATTMIAGFAGAGFAQSINGEVGGVVSQNGNGDLTFETSIDLGAEYSLNENSALFGNVTVLAFDDAVDQDLLLDGWYVGYRTGNWVTTFGDQSDLFAMGDGLNEVGGNVLADPAVDDQNLQVSYLDYGFMLGVTDVTEDDVEVTNVQVSAGHAYGNGVSVLGVVDYNTTTEDYTLGVAGEYAMQNRVTLTGAVTYADMFAYQVGAKYNGVTGYVAGDEVDSLAEAAVGYEWTMGKANTFAEVAYDFRTDEATPAVGVSFKF